MNSKFIVLPIFILCALLQKSWAQSNQKIAIETRKDCLLDSICSSCCDPTSYYMYDFSCKSFYKVEGNRATKISRLNAFKVHYNRELKFKISNINRYVYNVDFAANDVHFTNEPPTLFKQLFLAESADSIISSMSSNKANLSREEFKAIEFFINSYKGFKFKYDSLRETQLKIYSYCSPSAPCTCGTDSFSALSNRLTQLQEAYVAAQATLKKQKAAAEKALATCKENEKNNAKITALKAEIEKLQTASRRNQSLIAAKEKELNALKGCSEGEKDELETKMEDLDETKETLETIWKAVSSLKDNDLFRLVLLRNNFVNDHFIFNAPPIFPQGNRLQLAFRISATDTAKRMGYMPMYDDSLQLDLPVLFKPFVTFSSGLFNTWGKKLTSDKYGFQPISVNGVVTDSAQYRLVDTGSTSRSWGFASFANLGFKFTNTMGVGISLGVGLTMEEKPRPAYLAGLSFYAGDKKQFNITAGCAALQVNRLKSSLYPDPSTTVYDTKPTIEYTQSLKTGWFFSITYAVHTVESRNSVKGR
jgi:hypothetical protein